MPQDKDNWYITRVITNNIENFCLHTDFFFFLNLHGFQNFFFLKKKQNNRRNGLN